MVSINALKPGADKIWLVIISAVIWSGVGIYLDYLAFGWLRPLNDIVHRQWYVSRCRDLFHHVQTLRRSKHHSHQWLDWRKVMHLRISKMDQLSAGPGHDLNGCNSAPVFPNP
jgi:hypothetical protein